MRFSAPASGQQIFRAAAALVRFSCQISSSTVNSFRTMGTCPYGAGEDWSCSNPHTSIVLLLRQLLQAPHYSGQRSCRGDRQAQDGAREGKPPGRIHRAGAVLTIVNLTDEF